MLTASTSCAESKAKELIERLKEPCRVNGKRIPYQRVGGGDGNSDGELNLPISVAERGGSNSGSVPERPRRSAKTARSHAGPGVGR